MMKPEEKTEITKQALRFAKAMKAPLIFCSSSHSINIKTIFKIVVSKVFDLKCDVKKIDTVGDPIVGMIGKHADTRAFTVGTMN